MYANMYLLYVSVFFYLLFIYHYLIDKLHVIIAIAHIKTFGSKPFGSHGHCIVITLEQIKRG